ncbi:hypothetical protein FO519_010135 [Halicephalobus sp. NKZ332]|nr:hypothetical protein FO519_010135 [Halicephalobus sp. NKZ332]
MNNCNNLGAVVKLTIPSLISVTIGRVKPTTLYGKNVVFNRQLQSLAVPDLQLKLALNRHIPKVTPSPPPPMPKSIDKWMFYAVDSAGKSTVVCIHPRYFVTFRHGTHLHLQVGNTIRIFHAKSETNEQDGYEVTVVDMNEKLDFILLRSKEIIVPKSPRLAIAEESENFLLAGFGDHSTGQQQLAYLNGIIHSVRGYYFSINDRPALLMGPFVLGTGQSSRGNSGGACWSAKGLIGINFGVTNMPETTHSFAISEAATFSPKNIISPSIPYIKDLLMAQLRIEKQNSPKPPPEKKRKPYRVDVEGIGTGSLTIDFDES